jgi:hypothetical protein
MCALAYAGAAEYDGLEIQFATDKLYTNIYAYTYVCNMFTQWSNEVAWWLIYLYKCSRVDVANKPASTALSAGSIVLGWRCRRARTSYHERGKHTLIAHTFTLIHTHGHNKINAQLTAQQLQESVGCTETTHCGCREQSPKRVERVR